MMNPVNWADIIWEEEGQSSNKELNFLLKTSDFVLGLMLFSFAVIVHESSFFLKDRSLLSVFVKVQHIPKICGICIECHPYWRIRRKMDRPK